MRRADPFEQMPAADEETKQRSADGVGIDEPDGENAPTMRSGDKAR